MNEPTDDIIELSLKNPLEVFYCDDGRVIYNGKILSKKEVKQLEEQIQLLKDIHDNPRAARLAIKINRALDRLNPFNWFKK